MEFIPILSGSRYITVPLASAASTVSSVSHGNASIVSGHIVVYPIDTADLYSPTDAAPSSITGVTGSVPVGTNNVTISLGAAHQFVGDSPDKRIYSVAQPVAYCQPAGSDRVYRYANYGFNSVAVLPPTGGSKDVLLDDLDSAAPVSFDYASATLARNAVIGFELRASVNGETLLLGQEAQIRNVP